MTRPRRSQSTMAEATRALQATISDLRTQLARIADERDEALAQQGASADILAAISSSGTQLQPVFEIIVERTTRLCDAAFACVGLFEGPALRFAAISGVSANCEFFSPQRLHPPGGCPYVVPLARAKKTAQTPDVRAEKGYRERDPFYTTTADVGGARTALRVPLLKENMVLGHLWAFRQEERLFSDKQVTLLQNFAAQAVIAMENARLVDELRARTNEVASWNRELEARVAAQLAELERIGKLKRFLPPQLAELIVARGDESILESHRREIVVVFCDLRGFTSFAERAEPEEVMAVLRDYHAAVGPIIARFEGTLDHYSGDGIMVFFNDPLPTPEPDKRAIAMALAMREAVTSLLDAWRRRGHDIGFGIGISEGYATLGQIGFAERVDYTAIGTVTNLAARLCAEAKDGQILISRRVAMAAEEIASLEIIGDLSLKGLSRAVAVYNIR
jgi:adenylate cyclase